MKFRATIDFDITDECMETIYSNSIYKLKEEMDAYFKKAFSSWLPKEWGNTRLL